MEQTDFKKNWKEIVSGFLKLGATAYGGPAIYGILQAELQEKRQWVSKEHFVEGVSLANLIPGATMTQLCMFLGYARGGFWGGLLAGLCLVRGFRCPSSRLPRKRLPRHTQQASWRLPPSSPRLGPSRSGAA